MIRTELGQYNLGLYGFQVNNQGSIGQSGSPVKRTTALRIMACISTSCCRRRRHHGSLCLAKMIGQSAPRSGFQTVANTLGVVEGVVCAVVVVGTYSEIELG